MGASDLKGAFEHRPIHTLRRFYIFMRRANPFEPVEPAEPLLREIKGQLDQRLTLNPQSSIPFFICHFPCRNGTI